VCQLSVLLKNCRPFLVITVAFIHFTRSLGCRPLFPACKKFAAPPVGAPFCGAPVRLNMPKSAAFPASEFSKTNWVLQGSVETLLRWGGKRQHYFVAYLSKTQFYQNQPRFIENVTKKTLVCFFLGHGVVKTSNSPHFVYIFTDCTTVIATCTFCTCNVSVHESFHLMCDGSRGSKRHLLTDVSIYTYDTYQGQCSYKAVL